MRLIIASEERKRARDRLTHEVWGQRISLEAFCRREERLRAHAWCQGGMTTWLWVDDDEEVLASCETFRMRSFLRGAASWSFGVASVFTEERLRGRGHALAMMRALVSGPLASAAAGASEPEARFARKSLCVGAPHWALGAELRRSEPEAHGVLLFSEVGATLYERAGFVPRSCHDRVLPARAAALPEGARTFAESEAAALLERIPLPSQEFVVWPDAAQIDWHLERARIYAAAMGRTAPPFCGVEIGAARALWAADFKNERLAVLLASAPNAAAARPLLAAAQQAAASAGLATVRIWETPSLPLPPEAGERVARDDDALPMILPFAPGLEAGAWGDIPRALWV